MNTFKKKEIANSLEVLRNQEVLLYPTDTVWGLGCDATSANAVDKIYQIKQRSESKSLIILVADIEMLQKFIQDIPRSVLEVLRNVSKPTSIIYKNPIGLASNVVASDCTVAIRIPENDFCKELIAQFGKPIVSTSANISGMPTPQSFKEIDAAILGSVHYVVNLQREARNEKSSTILKVEDTGEIVVLRA